MFPEARLAPKEKHSILQKDSIIAQNVKKDFVISFVSQLSLAKMCRSILNPQKNAVGDLYKDHCYNYKN